MEVFSWVENKIPELRRWGGHRDPYRAPETGGLYLTGRVSGDPRFPRGARIQTSEVISSEGRVVTTQGGTRYRLVGPPHPDYVKFAREHDIVIDPVQPVKIHG